MEEDEEILKAKLNTETGRIGWDELQKHFARGVVIKVGPTGDLVEIAAAFTRDEKKIVSQAMDNGIISKATDADAIDWQQRKPGFWAVVVAPWVLVQESVAAE